jgi:hypothetical protein
MMPILQEQGNNRQIFFASVAMLEEADLLCTRTFASDSGTEVKILPQFVPVLEKSTRRISRNANA